MPKKRVVVRTKIMAARHPHAPRSSVSRNRLNLTPEEMTSYAQAFQKFDKDGSGAIDTKVNMHSNRILGALHGSMRTLTLIALLIFNSS